MSDARKKNAPNTSTTVAPRSVLVIGGSGFIGSRLELALKSQDLSVFTAGRSPSSAANYFRVDFAVASEAREFLSKHSFDWIFNCAGKIDHSVAPGKFEETFRLNTLPVLNLLESLSTLVVRPILIHVGSNTEYGAASVPQSGSTVPLPISPYGLMKLAATQAVQLAARGNGQTAPLQAVVARSFLVYGPGAPSSNLVEQLIASTVDGKRLELTAGEQTRDFVHVDFVARELIALAKAVASGEEPLSGQIVNLCTGHERTVASVVQLVQHIAPSCTAVLGAKEYRPGELMRSVGIPWRTVSKADADAALAEYVRSEVVARASKVSAKNSTK